jgi:stage II sporulation protein D
VLTRALLAAAAAALALAGAASAFLATSPTGTGATTTTATTATTTTTTTGSTTRPTTTTRTSTATTTTTTTTSTTTTIATVAARTAVVLNGHGWGHGLGMSQWGANGFAQHGWTYDRILAHYYRSTTLGPAPVARVRVLLLEGARTLAIRSTKPWRATGADGVTVDLPAGTIPLTPALKYKNLLLVAPVTFSPLAGVLAVGGKQYRGTLVVSVAKGKLQVVNSLGLEAYLKGVVPSEMPSAWPLEALKAQAVAARSYALANLAKGRTYDLYSDVRSQVYGGIAAEAASASAAIDATAGEVVLYDGKVATTYFFSTSGGRTASALEATGRSIPYLVSVPDPYDGASPHHNWGPVVLDAASVAKRLNVPAVLDLRTTLGPSARVQRVAAVTPLGETFFTGSQLRTLLGLDSTWFTVGWLSLAPPKAPVTYGGAGSVTGVARSVGAATLEARPRGGLWQTVRTVAPAANGSFAAIVKPQVTTEYRLATAGVRAALVKVGVAPRVTARLGAGAVTGNVRPALARAAVQLQGQTGATWSTVASGVTDASGSFSLATGAGAASAYRVRAAPGQGLVPGFSAPLLAR